MGVVVVLKGWGVCAGGALVPPAILRFRPVVKGRDGKAGADAMVGLDAVP
jgi:hypothetical protein